MVVVVVVVGPYRVFDGGVFANRLFKITGRRSILSIICHELARAAKRIFRKKNSVYRRGPVGPLPEKSKTRKKHVYGVGPLGPLRKKSNTRRTVSIGEVP